MVTCAAASNRRAGRYSRKQFRLMDAYTMLGEGVGAHNGSAGGEAGRRGGGGAGEQGGGEAERGVGCCVAHLLGHGWRVWISADTALT